MTSRQYQRTPKKVIPFAFRCRKCEVWDSGLLKPKQKKNFRCKSCGNITNISYTQLEELERA